MHHLQVINAIFIALRFVAHTWAEIRPAQGAWTTKAAPCLTFAFLKTQPALLHKLLIKS